MGSKSTSESKTAVDPELLNLYKKNYSNATDVADNYSYVPFTGERVAGFNPTQTQGFDFLKGVAADPTSTNAIGGSLNTTRGLLDYQPGQLSKTDLTPYLNPFTNDVVNTTLGDLSHARDQQQVSDNASATKAGAFGGTRQSVLNANTTDDYLRNVASTSANLRSGAFTNAQNAALSDFANQNTGAGIRLNAAGANAALGDDYLNNQAKRGGILSAVGDQQQGLQQSQDQAAYEEFLRQIQAPLQAQQIRNQALGMIPMQQTQTTNSSSSPGLGGILGGIGSLGLGIASLGTGSLGGGLLSGLFGGASGASGAVYGPAGVAGAW